MKGTWLRMLALAVAPACWGQPGKDSYVIDTVAGQGMLLGDGGPALAAQFYSPCGLALDKQGNLFVADRDNFRVRMISPDGTITTVAGGGGYGFGGDGGPAADSQLQEVSGLALDGAGNLYVADYFNHRIRRISPDGIINTYAGSGQSGYDGDGGPAVKARLNHPVDIAVDAAGTLYLADRDNHRVRKISPDGTITTIAGTGEAGFGGDGGAATAARLNRPSGVAVDAAGNVYFSDLGNFRVRKISGSGTITTVAGTGDRSQGPPGASATRTNLNNPAGLVQDGDGNLYIADAFTIWKVTPGGAISAFAGGSQDFNTLFLEGVPATWVFVAYPTNLLFDDSGSLYFSAQGEERVRKITPDGTVRTIAGASHFYGDGAPAISAGLFQPVAVALDNQGNLFIADTGNQRVRKMDPSGRISTVAAYPDVIVPCGVVVDRAGNLLVPDCAYQHIRKIDSAGHGTAYAGGGNDRSGATGPATAAGLELGPPIGAALDDAGNLYFAESGAHRIRKVTPGGTVSTVAGSGQAGFSGDGGVAVRALLNTPAGVAVDSGGNVFFADSGNGRVRRIAASDGVITTVASSLSGTGVAVDAAGNLFVSDTYRNRVLRMAPGASLTPIAGNGTGGFSGDGGPALNASLQYPQLLALDSSGNVYVPDSGNQRVRRLSPAPAPAPQMTIDMSSN